MARTKTSRIRQSPKRPAAQRHRELLDAARHLFMKNGYRETSMDHIARQVGLTKGALYFHFHSKEDILFQLVESIHQDVMAQLLALPRGKARPVDVLRVLLKVHLEAASPPFERFLDFWLQASKIPHVHKFLCGHTNDFWNAFDRVIDTQYARTPRERRDLGVLVLATAEGLGVRKIMGDPYIDFSRQSKLFAALTDVKKHKTQRA